MNLVQFLDQVVHFLFLVALAPFVLSVLCWLIYGHREIAGHSGFMGFRDPEYGDVLVEMPRRSTPTWAT